MSFIRQTRAILTVLKLKTARNITEPLEQFLFPVIIAMCVVFMRKYLIFPDSSN